MPFKPAYMKTSMVRKTDNVLPHNKEVFTARFFRYFRLA